MNLALLALAPIVMRMGTPATVQGLGTDYFSRNTSAAYAKPLTISFWANRQIGPARKPNPVWPAQSYWMAFTSVAKADAATKATVAYTLGDPAWKAIAASAGLKVIAWGTIPVATAASFGPYRVVTDIFVQPPANSVYHGGKGTLALDFEPQDWRQPAQTMTLFSWFTEYAHAHGFKAMLYTNPWDGLNMPLQGLAPAGAKAMIGNFDYVTNMVRPGGPRGSAQAEYAFGATIVPPAHELVAPFLTIGQADACFLHAEWKARHFPGFMVFNDALDPNAPENVAKIAALASGQGC